MGRNRLVVLQFRQDLFCELLAKFNTPLVEAEDIPDNTLDKDLVFIHRDEISQGAGSEFLEEDGVRRPVSFEDSIGSESHNLLIRFPFFSHVTLNLIICFSVHESLGLGEEVR